MDDIQRMMDRNIERELNQTHMQSTDDQGYALQTERLSKLYKLRADEVLAEKELALKEKQAEDAKKQGWLRTGVEVAGVILPLCLYAVWMRKGFEFETNGAITSQTFKGLIQKFKPFK